MHCCEAQQTAQLMLVLHIASPTLPLTTHDTFVCEILSWQIMQLLHEGTTGSFFHSMYVWSNYLCLSSRIVPAITLSIYSWRSPRPSVSWLVVIGWCVYGLYTPWAQCVSPPAVYACMCDYVLMCILHVQFLLIWVLRKAHSWSSKWPLSNICNTPSLSSLLESWMLLREKGYFNLYYDSVMHI